MSDLVIQLALGALLITIATVLQVMLIGLMMKTVPRLRPLLRDLSILRVSITISVGGLWMIVAQLLGVWVWTLALISLGAFSMLEVSLYFTLSAYTTLGFGDVLPPAEWRILGALIGANGMLGFGLATAALVEFIAKMQRILRD